MSQRRSTIRLKDFDYSDPNYVYFVTICARHLKEPFRNRDLAQEVVRALFHLNGRDETLCPPNKRISLYCYCLMPDHFHGAVSPKYENLSKVLGDFKSYTTQIAWRFGVEGKLWQRSFYDHVARQGEDLLSICQYILANPMRKGLVRVIEDWPYGDLVDPLPF